MDKQIYIIQEVVEGVANCPILMTDEEKADKHYIDLVNEVHDKDFKTEKEASDFLRESQTMHDIYYWIQEIK